MTHANGVPSPAPAPALAPPDDATRAGNNAALERLLGHWQRQDELAKGPKRPAVDARSAAVERARLYAAKEPPAIEGAASSTHGTHGSGQCFHVACVLVQGFDLSEEEALAAIQDWNRTCKPPWSEGELRHKIADAAKAPLPKGKERGYLLSAVRSGFVQLNGGNGESAPPSEPSKGGSPSGGTSPARAEEKPVPVIVRMADVEPRPVRWLWRHWLPCQSLAILDGDPARAKSTLTLDLAARVTTGRAMPPLGGEKDLSARPAAVLLLGAEDSLEQTVRPRLDAAGADCNLVHSLEAVRTGDEARPPVLPYDLELVADLIVSLKVALVVVDPVMGFIDERYDAHKDQDIRRCLRPLADLARRLDISILLVRHLNKASGGPALYRGGGSIGITGAARSALITGFDPQQEGVHVLAMNKANLGPLPKSLAYKIEIWEHPKAGPISRIAWLGESELRPHEILGHPGEAANPVGRPSRESDAARSLLAELLAAGETDVAAIRARAKAEGISWRTIERARAGMDIESVKRDSGWRWRLRAQEEEIPAAEPPAN